MLTKYVNVSRKELVAPRRTFEMEIAGHVSSDYVIITGNYLCKTKENGKLIINQVEVFKKPLFLEMYCLRKRVQK